MKDVFNRKIKLLLTVFGGTWRYLATGYNDATFWTGLRNILVHVND